MPLVPASGEHILSYPVSGTGRGLMAIELVPLCTLRLQSKPPIAIGKGPAGTRLVSEVANGEV